MDKRTIKIEPVKSGDIPENCPSGSVEAEYSQAISLKRIADTLDSILMILRARMR